MKRVSDTRRQVRAGCYDCHGGLAHWLGRNALALATRHHDATGHRTWCDQTVQTIYGAADAAHPDLFAELT